MAIKQDIESPPFTSVITLYTEKRGIMSQARENHVMIILLVTRLNYKYIFYMSVMYHSYAVVCDWKNYVTLQN